MKNEKWNSQDSRRKYFRQFISKQYEKRFFICFGSIAYYRPAASVLSLALARSRPHCWLHSAGGPSDLRLGRGGLAAGLQERNDTKSEISACDPFSVVSCLIWQNFWNFLEDTPTSGNYLNFPQKLRRKIAGRIEKRSKRRVWRRLSPGEPI